MSQTFVSSNEEYRGFNLYGRTEAVTGTLLGNVNHWKPTDCIAFKHAHGVISELTWFRFPMNCDDEGVAKCFGLEIARLLLGRKLIPIEPTDESRQLEAKLLNQMRDFNYP